MNHVRGFCFLSVLCMGVVNALGNEFVVSSAVSSKFKMDTRTETRMVNVVECEVCYSSLWHGDDTETVTISRDGAILVERLTGEGVFTWRPSRTGTNVLTHVTWSGEVPVNVETATFVVLPDCFDPMYDTPENGIWLTPSSETQPYGSLELNEDNLYDFFRVSLKEGRTYMFETTGSGDTYGELFSSASTDESYRVAYNDDDGDGRNFKIVYTPTASGTYYLRVRAHLVGSALSYALKYGIVGLASNDISVSGYSGKYDGKSHGFSVSLVSEDIVNALVMYATTRSGPYSPTKPTLTDAGTLTTWYVVSVPGYVSVTNSATVTVSKRNVTLASGGATKFFDGTALTYHKVSVGGDGFAPGEGASCSFTGSQTAVGSSANTFTYTLDAGTKASNYNITKATGNLNVTETPSSGTVAVEDWTLRYEFAADGTAAVVGVDSVGASGRFSIPSSIYCRSVTRIGAKALRNCTRLTGVVVPDGVTSIGDRVFQGCGNLVDVSIPSSVTSIGNYAFSGCSGLTSIVVDSANSIYKSVNGMLLSKDGRTLWAGVNGDVRIPNGVTSIGGCAFSGCSGLTSVFFDGDAPDVVGENVFPSTAVIYVVQPDSTGWGVDIPGAWNGVYIRYAPVWGWSGTYDGAEHGVSVSATSTVTSASVMYATTRSGPYSPTKPTLTDAGTLTTWYVVSVPGYLLLTNSATVTVSRRNVTLASGNATKFFDGTALTCHRVSVGGDGFAPGEGASYSFTGSQTAVGSSANTFAYTLDAGTKASNYNIAKTTGNLSVTETPSSGTVAVEDWTLRYEFDADGTAAVVGVDSVGASGRLSIPSSIYCRPVARIGAEAFRNCARLTGVVVPDGVTSIGDRAFQGCGNLVDVSIPSSVTNIGYRAFSGCSGLTRVTVPECVCASGLSNVFPDAYAKIAEVVVADGTARIGDGAFRNCAALKSVSIPDSVASVGAAAFDGGADALYDTKTVAGAVLVDGWAVGYTRTEAMLDLSGIRGIAASAFLDGTGLTSVAIPQGVREISASAFKGCAHLFFVSIPPSVTNVAASAFSGCGALAALDLPVGLTAVADNAFHNCSSLTSVAIPSGVTRIGANAFHGCSGLASVSISPGVTQIGADAFHGCSGLTSVAIPSSVTQIGAGAFHGCLGLTSVAIPAGVAQIGADAFNGCRRLTSVTIPAGVTNVADRTFAFCSGLREVSLPDSLVRIGAEAFRGCSSLAAIAIPDRVEYIGADAFDGCGALASVRVNDYLCDGRFADVFSPTTVRTLEISDRVSSIGAGAFEGCTGLVSVSIPTGVRNVQSNAFAGCTGLTSLELPSGVSSVGAGAFKGCTGLVSVSIPPSVRKILDRAFSGCTGLKALAIPQGVSHIGTDAFAGCTGLASLEIPTGVSYMGAGAFSGCTGLADVAVPAGTTNVVDRLFHGCSGLVSVTLPGSVTRIGSEAFRNCSSLAEIVIPDGVSAIGANAFAGCSSLVSVTVPAYLCDGKFAEVFSRTTVRELVIADGVAVIGESAFRNCTGLRTVTIPASVRTLLDYSFTGCTGVTAVHFGGDAPYISADWLPPNAVLYVPDGAEGWIFGGTWFGHEVRRCATLSPSDVSVAGWSGKYDGAAHGVSVSVKAGISGAKVAYATTRNGPYASVKPTLTDAGTLTTWCVVSAPGYAPLTNAATVAVSKRNVTLASGSASKTHDGTALTCREMSVGGDGFVAGEGATYLFTGSQTGVGSSANTFTYTLKSGTKAANYDITRTYGTLTVRTGADGVAPGGVGTVSANGRTWTYKVLSDGTASVTGVSPATGALSIPSTLAGRRVAWIAAYAFRNCTGLTSVSVSSSVRIVGSGAFDGCTKLKTVTLADGVEEIREFAFGSCASLRTISLPASVRDVAWAFEDCGALESIAVAPANATYKSVDGLLLSKDGRTLWEGVNGDVRVPAGVETVAEAAFSGRTGLKTVFLPASVEEIDECAFMYCSGLRSFAVDPANAAYRAVDGLLLSKDGGTLVEGVNGDVRVPGCVERIAVDAFYGRTGLKTVFLPASVLEVGDPEVDAGAFGGCSGLRSFAVDAGNPSYRAVDGLLLSKDGRTLVEGVNGDVRIPDGVARIAGEAFDGRSGLTAVTLPASVSYVGAGAFYGCTGLKAATFLGDAPAFEAEWDGEYDDEEDEEIAGVLPAGCTVYVPRGSSGWGVPIPGTWRGHPIRYGTGASSGGSGGGAAASTSALKFAKTAVSVRESAAYVDVTVNRMGKDGRVRVKYATADGTAVAGEDYVETSGVLEWADGDRKAKKIRVPLVPDLVAAYDGVPSKTFSVCLEPLGADELDGGERLADVSGGDVCTVTVMETSRSNVTTESVYAKKAAKRATVKTESVPLWSGSFHGVLASVEGSLTNGAPRLATCSVTVSKGAKPSISAKVKVAGKTYSFSGKGWDADEWDDGFVYVGQRTLTRTWKKNGETYVDELVLSFNGEDELTSGDGAWQWAGGSAELLLNVPDAKGNGVQPGVRYSGSLRRDNAKIQDYLDAALKFAGYYTVALVADGGAGRPALPDGGTDAQSAGRPALPDGGTDAQSVGRDVPVAPNGGRGDDEGVIGNGYLTLTIDNKGKAKVAGMLADGTTRPSASMAACRVEEDSSSANGWSMYVDVFHSTATVCFGGTLRLYAVEDFSNPDGSGIRIVVDSSNLLAWYDDSSTGCVALYGDGEGISLAPCGGWYDKVVNLQRYYLDYALAVETADVSAFPADELPDGYGFVTGVSPSGFALALENDKVVHDRKKIVKTNRLTDFDLSVNPCNVSVRLARATGLVTGSFSLWAEDWDSGKQKEVTGFKTYGVLLLARDPSAPLDDRVVAPGFATKKIKTTYYDDSGRKKTLTWPFSMPFNVEGE